MEVRAASQTGYAANWRQALGILSGLEYRRDNPSPTYDYDGERLQIPRYDLPFGTLGGQATSGSRAVRARRGGTDTSDYYKIRMPAWAAALKPVALTPAEQTDANTLKATL
jgi:hypothetical protein